MVVEIAVNEPPATPIKPSAIERLEKLISGYSNKVLENVERLKSTVFAVAMVITIISVSYTYGDSDASLFGTSYCDSMVQTGRWFHDMTRWQPLTCALSSYTQSKLSRCISASQPVEIIGDSIARNLFVSFKEKLGGGLMNQNNFTAHEDMNEPELGLTFVWNPYLNRTLTHSNAVRIIVGGHWFIKNLEYKDGLRLYATSMTSILESAEHLTFVLPVNWVDESKLSDSRKSITNKIVFSYNELLKKLYREVSRDEVNARKDLVLMLLWSSMSRESIFKTEDGLHFDRTVYDALSEVIYNRLCNEKLQDNKPLATSCCASYAFVHWKQISTFAILFLLGPAAYAFRKLMPSSGLVKYLPSEEVAYNLSVFFAAMLAIFFADRTHLFIKHQKEFNLVVFAIVVLSLIMISLCFVVTSDNTSVLHRDLTDEWKGWMQLLILVYHYFGASSVSPIYNAMREMVASYLFMTGYGHFIFFYKKKDFGLKRVLQVLVRLNLFPVLLSYTMNSSFQAYYFSPLVSFWFIVIYLVMFAGHQWNPRPSFLVGKLIVSTVLFQVLFSAGILDAVVHFYVAVSGSVWDSNEWRFRVALDQLIVFAGMLFGFVSTLYLDKQTLSSPLFQKSAYLVGITGLVIFAALWSGFDKYDYNKIHPWISPVFVISYVLLRNATSDLRRQYSVFCAYFGKISLETFILQFHIWLALDTKGILVIIPQSAFVNFILTSMIFIYLSEKVSQATSTLCGTIFKDEAFHWKLSIVLLGMAAFNHMQ